MKSRKSLKRNLANMGPLTGLLALVSVAVAGFVIYSHRQSGGKSYGFYARRSYAAGYDGYSYDEDPY